MSLQVPSYPNPYSTEPITNAYAWIGYLGIDFTAGIGRVQVVVNFAAADAAAGLPPVDSWNVALGQMLAPADPDADPPTAEVDFPTLANLIDAAAATAAASTPNLDPFTALRTVLYGALLDCPLLAGSALVP